MALPSADCAKGGYGAYTNSVDLKGYENGVIQASEFCTYHTPLNKQSGFVNAMKAVREFVCRVIAMFTGETSFALVKPLTDALKPMRKY